MRILKIVVTGTVLLLAACAEPQSQSVLSMTKVLASESTNLSIVECSLGIKMLDDKGNSYQDTSGICVNEMNLRLKSGTMTQAELEIDKNRAQNEIAQYQQQLAIAAANDREERTGRQAKRLSDKERDMPKQNWRLQLLTLNQTFWYQ
ncbi:TPA: hypothetical protein MHR78_07995 [Klebsiella variicola]|uniref:hypothetical protein n=2 Tax=Klebsiella variicola TaxID=244366 RepID=UPI000D741507|nr:hypothetical protein [Klebsiella variicola]HBZ7505434.1 hypothetical protein [Klebsiella variicola subsp. variicola]MBZ7121422.1 hypothetical protein [Klebsiella variicola]NKC07913.1 hypothetical protein [Klebsiella variicola]PXH51087.1 hypothetical protein DMS67_03360 [Klebsiella variicola]PXK35669.1 hypothetical protein DMR24_18780 [Klebsiella variicola]